MHTVWSICPNHSLFIDNRGNDLKSQNKHFNISQTVHGEAQMKIYALQFAQACDWRDLGYLYCFHIIKQRSQWIIVYKMFFKNCKKLNDDYVSSVFYLACGLCKVILYNLPVCAIQ